MLNISFFVFNVKQHHFFLLVIHVFIHSDSCKAVLLTVWVMQEDVSLSFLQVLTNVVVSCYYFDKTKQQQKKLKHS